MKRLPPQIRHALVLVSLFMLSPFVSKAQNSLVDEYLKEAGSAAQLYSGEIETIYNPFLYRNDPYYKSSEHADGELIYRGNYYPNQSLRLDLYKEQLTLLTPTLRLGIVVNPMHLGEANIHGRTIIYHTPPQESGLKQGYYIQLYNGASLRLLSRFTVKKDNVRDGVIEEFTFVQRYYVLQNGAYNLVRNKKTFIKLFPLYKKEINRYCKENKIEFSRGNEESFIKLTEFCEEITRRPAL